MDIQKLLDERASTFEQAKELIERAEKENRSMSAEENAQYDKMNKDMDSLTDRVEKIKKQNERSSYMSESQGRVTKDSQETSIYEDYIKRSGDLTKRQAAELRATPEYREAYQKFLAFGSAGVTSDELRAMQADSAIGGGYTIAPQEMVRQLLKDVDDVAVIRQFAEVYQVTTSDSLGVPTLEKDADDADWTAELKTGSETEMEFGKRELKPYPLAKRVKLSNKLMRLSIFNAEQLVRERLAYKFGISQEKAFMTGDGVQKPLGLFVASSDGISTDRDKACGLQTKVKPDEIIDTKHMLKPQYWAGARWLFHRDILAHYRKMKDGNGQYIWQPGLQAGAPDRLLDIPYTLSEYAPKTLTSGLYVTLLGNLKYYWIADALDMQVQRLVELYAETNQTGFIGRMETDAMPVLEEAFVRVKMA